MRQLLVEIPSIVRWENRVVSKESQELFYRNRDRDWVEIFLSVPKSLKCDRSTSKAFKGIAEKRADQ